MPKPLWLFSILTGIMLLFPPFFKQARCQGLSSALEQIRQQHDLMGGAVAFFCESGIQEEISFGMADMGRQIPVTDSTVFRIASISKTITAIAFLQLWEQNLIDLDEDIGNLLGFSVRNSNFPAKAITPRMLLNHTSSLIDGSTYSGFLTATLNQPQVPPLSELLTPTGSFYSSGQFLQAQPGSYFSYANVNAGILGTLTEIISGQRFDVYCEQNIFAPLGLRASFLVNNLPNLDQIAVLYRKQGGTWIPQADNYSGVAPGLGNLPGYVPGTNAFRFAPQGGLRISAKDLATLFLALMKGGSLDGTKILDSSTVSLMLSDHWTWTGNNGNDYDGLFRSWGLGIHRASYSSGGDVVLPGSVAMTGHPGEAYGLVSDAYFDLQRKIGFVFVTNGCGTGYQTGPGSAFYTVEKAVFEAIETQADWENCYSLTTENQVPKKNLWSVTPNPAQNTILVKVPDNLGNLKFYIQNMMGEILLRGQLENESQFIDIRQLPHGSFLLVPQDRTCPPVFFIKLTD